MFSKGKPDKSKSIDKASGEHEVDFKPDECVYIWQQEFGITRGDQEKHVLGSDRAFACVILTLHDKKNDIAILAHVDSVSDLEPLRIICHSLSCNDVTACIVGGNSKEAEAFLNVIDLMNDAGIKTVYTNVGMYTFKERASLAIDARTGEIYSPVSKEEIAKPKSRNRETWCQLNPIALSNHSPLTVEQLMQSKVTPK